jgi:DNA-directed RNA polymerase sigma subunit (sigma70/sigma32)
MRNRRKELGLTQRQLAEMAGTNQASISQIELLKNPTKGKTKHFLNLVNQKLRRIAQCLDMDFEELFPEDYLEMLEARILPQSTHYQWIYDVSLDQLPSPENYPALLAPSPEEMMEGEILVEAMAEVVKVLPPKLAKVIRLRYGLEDGIQHTLEDVGLMFGVSKERIRQYELKALGYLRAPHSKSRRLLSEFLDRGHYPKTRADRVVKDRMRSDEEATAEAIKRYYASHLPADYEARMKALRDYKKRSLIG